MDYGTMTIRISQFCPTVLELSTHLREEVSEYSEKGPLLGPSPCMQEEGPSEG